MVDIAPPPSVVDLTEDKLADSIWKTWFNLLREALQVELWRNVGGTDQPAFLNSWANVGTAGLPPAGFYKDPFGRVHLRGNIDTGLTGTTAFTLPTGYRPPYKVVSIVYNNNGGPGPGGANVFLTVNTDGTVVPTFSAGTDMWLDGTSFRI